MKKIISVIIAVMMVFCLCLPAFAAQSATFAVNVVSEDNTRAVVSIDYEGGTAFNCLDFEITLSSRVTVEKSANGAGLRNFKIYAEDTEKSMVINSFNKDSNPMMFTFASLTGFKAVNGKDLIVLTLKKSSSDKLTANDVKLSVTNCGISGTSVNSVVAIEAKAIQIGGSADIKTSAAAGQAGTAVEKTNASVRTTTTSAVTTTADSSELSAESTTIAEIVSDKDGENTDAKKTDKKKIIVVGAAAVIVLAIIVVGVVVIAKKYKKEDAE